MSKLINSAAGNSFYTAGGVAITTSTQPKLDGGAIAGVKTSSINGTMKGVDPVVESVFNIEYSGTSTHRAPVSNVSVVTESENKTNKVYKIRNYKIKSAFRANKFNHSTNTFDASYPQSSDDTLAMQIANATGVYPNDKATQQRVTYSYGLPNPSGAIL